MTTYYVDGVSGNDSNAGTSFGAAWATIAKLAATAVAGDTGIICATGNYTLTSSVAWTVSGDTTSGPIIITGGNATGTVDGTRPTITSNTNSLSLFTTNALAAVQFSSLKFTHTAATRGDGIKGVTTNSSVTVLDCIFDGCLNGINGGTRGVASLVKRSTFQNCTSVGSTDTCLLFYDCLFYNNASHGIQTTYNGIVYGSRCVFGKNGGAGAWHSDATHSNTGLRFFECTFANNTGDGIKISGPNNMTLHLDNCIVYGNGGYGMDIVSGSSVLDAVNNFVSYCAFGSNTSGNGLNATTGIAPVTLTANPFTNAAAGDFSLNNTAGGGAACRAAGFPGAFPGGTTTGYLDIGAVQHQDAGVGGGINRNANMTGGFQRSNL